MRERSPQFAVLPSQVAAIVPTGSKEQGYWDVKEWLSPTVRCLMQQLEYLLIDHQEERKMVKFAHYAMAAAQEALDDAEWHPQKPEELEATVRPANLR